MTGPATYVSLRRHVTVDGRANPVGIVNRDLQLAAGTQLLVRRDGEHLALVAVPPTAPWQPTRRERTEAALANAPRGALRLDARDARHGETENEQARRRAGVDRDRNRDAGSEGRTRTP